MRMRTLKMARGWGKTFEADVKKAIRGADFIETEEGWIMTVPCKSPEVGKEAIKRIREIVPREEGER